MYIHIATGSEKKAAFDLRFEVFVNEQKVPPEIELDAEDARALHILSEENGACIGCARVIFSERDAHIGRLAVKKTHRGKGVGSAICRFILDVCKEWGYSHIWLGAQLRAVGFYEKLGFQPRGEVFWEAGIEHIEMAMDVGLC